MLEKVDEEWGCRSIRGLVAVAMVSVSITVLSSICELFFTIRTSKS